MQIESALVDGIRVVNLTGRMDALTAPQYDAWFDERVQADECRMVLNLAGVDYISSTGLRSLLSTAKQLKARAGALVLCGVAGAVAEVFALSGFMSIFTVVETTEEAMGEIR